MILHFSNHVALNLSNEHRHEKLVFCICENKGADQLCVNRTADQGHCFHYIDSTISTF